MQDLSPEKCIYCLNEACTIKIFKFALLVQEDDQIKAHYSHVLSEKHKAT